jgi:hypothetical protein
MSVIRLANHALAVEESVFDMTQNASFSTQGTILGNMLRRTRHRNEAEDSELARAIREVALGEDETFEWVEAISRANPKYSDGFCIRE